MNDSVNFKFGSTIEGKDIAANDLVVINEGIAEGGDERYGSIYKGDKIVGTTKADSLYTTDSITVTGVNVGNLTNGLEIEAGKSIMEVLRQMLMKELGVTATKPKATISGDSSRIVEKGEVVSGMTYTVTYTNGKYTGVSGYDYTMAAKCDISNVTWFGVSGVHSDDNLTVNAEDIVVTDKVEIYAQVSYDADSASKTPVTNFGNPITTGLIGAGTATTSKITYTPYLKWFVGSSKSKYEDTKWDTLMVKEGLTIAENWESTTTVNAVFPIAAKQQVIAVPSDYTISVTNKSGDNLTEMFSIITTVEVTCGGTHKEDYTLYIAPANAGLAADSPEMVITINK